MEYRERTCHDTGYYIVRGFIWTIKYDCLLWGLAPNKPEYYWNLWMFFLARWANTVSVNTHIPILKFIQLKGTIQRLGQLTIWRLGIFVVKLWCVLFFVLSEYIVSVNSAYSECSQ